MKSMTANVWLAQLVGSSSILDWAKRNYRPTSRSRRREGAIVIQNSNEMADQLFSEGLTIADSLLPSVRIFVTIVFILMKSIHVAEANATNESKQLKYILIWTNNQSIPVQYLMSGQEAFIKNKCPVSDCYVTSNRDFFGDDVTKFNAVIFNGRNLINATLSELPQNRSPLQKYIFLNTECSDNQPICTPIFDGFFNWTATYKLDSDIVNNYIEIINPAGEVVGPRIDMNWRNEMSNFSDSLLRTLKRKTKAAAWFASHCWTRGKRERYVKRLKRALKMHKLTLDIFGKCGNLKCRNSKKSKCINMLRDNYFFYLAFENSIATDYISEKALTALDSETVPIVFGGADYSRFLPYGSYIDARIYEPEDLASFMAEMISYPDEYREFFRWRNHYRYRAPNQACRICAALHDQVKFEAYSVYPDFRGWWNPDYKERCKDKTWGS